MALLLLRIWVSTINSIDHKSIYLYDIEDSVEQVKLRNEWNSKPLHDCSIINIKEALEDSHDISGCSDDSPPGLLSSYLKNDWKNQVTIRSKTLSSIYEMTNESWSNAKNLNQFLSPSALKANNQICTFDKVQELDLNDENFDPQNINNFPDKLTGKI